MVACVCNAEQVFNVDENSVHTVRLVRFRNQISKETETKEKYFRD